MEIKSRVEQRMIFDCWYRIVFYCNGGMRQNLSFSNKFFRSMITKQHIHLLKSERCRLFKFLIDDIASSTVQRFVSDFEFLVTSWRPPKNELLLNYVDYHYHLLFIVSFLLTQIDSLQLFFYYTNNCTLVNKHNIIKYLIQHYSTKSVISMYSLLYNFVIECTPLFESSPFDSDSSDSVEEIKKLHQSIFNKYKLIERNSNLYVDHDEAIMFHLNNPYESYALLYFSITDIFRRRKSANYGFHYYLSPEHLKITQYCRKLPQFANVQHDISPYQLLFSPLSYSQMMKILSNECQMYVFDEIVPHLYQKNDPVATLIELFSSNEYNFIKLIEHHSIISHRLFKYLFKHQKRARLFELYTKYYPLMFAFKNNAGDWWNFYSCLFRFNNNQIEMIYNFIISLASYSKNQVYDFFGFLGLFLIDSFDDDKLFKALESYRLKITENK